MSEFITEMIQREIGEATISTEASRKKAAETFSNELDSLSARVSKDWQGDVDAAQAVREQRRKL